MILVVELSCTTPKDTYPETNQESLCNDLYKIDSTVLQENSFQKYFFIGEPSNVNYYRNRLAHENTMDNPNPVLHYE